MSRILLVAPSQNVGKTLPETPSRALLILGTLALQRGHEVKILHADLLDGHIAIADEFALFKPDIIGITCNTFQVKSARIIVKEAKAFGSEVIIGGPHAIAWDGGITLCSKTRWIGHLPNGTIYKVIGEGENTFLNFIGETPNINSIDDIPIPNYDLVDLDRFCGIAPVGIMPAMAIMGSRGCPYNCSFCNTPIFWGKKIRYRNPQLVVDEVDLLHKQYGSNEIFFQDDTFNINHQWAYELFEEIIKRGLNRDMLFKIACRVNEKLITKEFLDLAYKAGVWNIFFGIESGSQEMLERMNKGITIAEIKRAVRLTHEAGIKTQCSFIVGMPGETLATLRETDKLIQEIKPTRSGWVVFCPFPGTEATKEVTAKGHKLDLDYAEYSYGKVIVRTDALDFNELEAFRGF